jgi:hypothetical protein
METILQHLWGAIHDPTAALAAIAAKPPFGAALGVLILLIALFIATSIIGESVRARRRSATILDERPLLVLTVLFVFVLTLWLWLTLLSLGVARLLGSPIPFETVCSLLIFSSMPTIVSQIVSPFRNWNRIAYYVWQAFQLAMLFWSILLIWLSLHIGVHLNTLGTLLVSLPSLCFLGALVLWEMLNPPESFLAGYFWRSVEGERVVIFYPREKSAEELTEILDGCDAVLAQLQDRLKVEPLPFKIYVFLFPDQKLHIHLVRPPGNPADGYSHDDSISLVFAPWSEICNTIAHELCHVLRAQRITKKLSGLLDEGLATYMSYQLFPTEDWPPAVTMPTSLRVLARYDVFFEGQHVKAPEFAPYDYYVHAHAFVGYMIERYGLEKFKRLCCNAGTTTPAEAGERLANAVQDIYGLSLKELEQQWRQAMSITKLILAPARQ